jgi:hypothetical protein
MVKTKSNTAVFKVVVDRIDLEKSSDKNSENFEKVEKSPEQLLEKIISKTKGKASVKKEFEILVRNRRANKNKHFRKNHFEAGGGSFRYRKDRFRDQPTPKIDSGPKMTPQKIDSNTGKGVDKWAFNR